MPTRGRRVSQVDWLLLVGTGREFIGIQSDIASFIAALEP